VADDAARARFSGLVLTPGASGRASQSGLVAIDDACAARGIVVSRVEFPGQSAGTGRPDPPDVCIKTVRDAALELAERLDVSAREIAVGGRSFGGRMCSMAVADGLESAGLVLVSYPLHPPGRPDRLRTAHFPALHVPCCFISGRRDPFAAPDELEEATAAIPGDVTLVLLDGDHSLRRAEHDVAAAVVAWALRSA
jgi:predicted alpha/beta-hydrolase family hydrolase